MKYYVTIYIDKLVEKELFLRLDLSHAFLGLTKGKNPDELIRWINGVCLHESKI